MAFYQFIRTHVLEAPISDVWDFISSPTNLKHITPEYMGFDILSKDLPEKMYEGMIIHYKVKPLPFMTTQWVTEITHVKEGEYFVDEQRMGPYKMWHHQHHLEKVKEGVLMTDIISYQPPMGILGQLANGLLIRSELNKIFDFRKAALEKYFMQPQGIIV